MSIFHLKIHKSHPVFLLVSSLIRLPKSSSTTTYKGNMKNFGTKIMAMAMNAGETMLIALTDSLQLVCHSFKGNNIS